MSVATSTWKRPLLKPARACVRWAWLRLPWIRSTRTPWRPRNSASRFARCLVRVKARTLRVPGRPRSCEEQARLQLGRDRIGGVRDAGRRRRPGAPPSIATGSRRISRASATIGGGMVAEKKSVCRRAGSARGCGGCPAGSPCRASGPPRRGPAPRGRRAGRRAARRWSSRRPGVATRTSTPRRKACSCGPMPTPPKTAAPVRRVWRPSSWRCSSICAASSRVGARTRARVVPRGLSDQPLEDRQQERGGLAAARSSRRRGRPGPRGPAGWRPAGSGSAPSNPSAATPRQEVGVKVERVERHGGRIPSGHTWARPVFRDVACRVPPCGRGGGVARSEKDSGSQVNRRSEPDGRQYTPGWPGVHEILGRPPV